MLEECESYKCYGSSDISKGETRSYTPKVSVMGTELKKPRENPDFWRLEVGSILESQIFATSFQESLPYVAQFPSAAWRASGCVVFMDLTFQGQVLPSLVGMYKCVLLLKFIPKRHKSMWWLRTLLAQRKLNSRNWSQHITKLFRKVIRSIIRLMTFVPIPLLGILVVGFGVFPASFYKKAICRCMWTCDYRIRITESLRLQKTSETINSNHLSSTAKSTTKPWCWVSNKIRIWRVGNPTGEDENEMSPRVNNMWWLLFCSP